MNLAHKPTLGGASIQSGGSGASIESGGSVEWNRVSIASIPVQRFLLLPSPSEWISPVPKCTVLVRELTTGTRPCPTQSAVALRSLPLWSNVLWENPPRMMRDIVPEALRRSTRWPCSRIPGEEGALFLPDVARP